jgi:predicted dehydrogenase
MTMARGDKRAEERIWGTNGTLLLAPTPSQVYTLRKVAGLKPGSWQGLGKLPRTHPVATYMDRLAARIFAGQPPEVTGQDGRENLAVVLAAYEAGREGRAVVVQGAGSGASEARVS